MPYRFTRRARDDLRDIAAYTRDRWGDVQCERYLTSLQSCCQQLAVEPTLRRQHPDDSRYWRALAGRHVVFYRVEMDASILVVRILHAAMLPELHLPETPDDDAGQDE